MSEWLGEGIEERLFSHSLAHPKHMFFTGERVFPADPAQDSVPCVCAAGAGRAPVVLVLVANRGAPHRLPRHGPPLWPRPPQLRAGRPPLSARPLQDASHRHVQRCARVRCRVTRASCLFIVEVFFLFFFSLLLLHGQAQAAVLRSSFCCLCLPQPSNVQRMH